MARIISIALRVPGPQRQPCASGKVDRANVCGGEDEGKQMRRRRAEQRFGEEEVVRVGRVHDWWMKRSRSNLFYERWRPRFVEWVFCQAYVSFLSYQFK